MAKAGAGPFAARGVDEFSGAGPGLCEPPDHAKSRTYGAMTDVTAQTTPGGRDA
ncbi:hypothetical protein ACFCYB_08420 [Streptomyces sp. NPDC056309]|uniref:hypothetical protein n=1 Tax=unclassified Streptomyces TaxID=2593676 RepID=UPI0035E173EA